ncbi:MAG: DoxX family protein [Anaerolineae bacterium]|nr:DoxX family protein [Anaerolineae bacterium]
MTTVQTLVLWLLAAVFIVAGVAHFTFLRRDFARIVPPILPYKDAIVLFTGLLEILGGVGLLLPQTTRWAGIALILYLIAVFPANIYGARHRIPIRGYPHPSVAVRLPFQIILIALLWWVSQTPL